MRAVNIDNRDEMSAWSVLCVAMCSDKSIWVSESEQCSKSLRVQIVVRTAALLGLESAVEKNVISLCNTFFKIFVLFRCFQETSFLPTDFDFASIKNGSRCCAGLGGCRTEKTRWSQCLSALLINILPMLHKLLFYCPFPFKSFSAIFVKNSWWKIEFCLQR